MSSNSRQKRERLLEAARGYLLLDLPDQALEQLGAVDDGDQSSFACNQLRGECYRQRKDYREALKAYHTALAERPTDLSVLLGMAWCYKRIDQLSEAIAVMERAYRIRPNEPIIMYNLSCYFALSGNKPQALSWLGRALRKERRLRKLISDESDFDRLRGDPDFQFVVESQRIADS